MKELKTKLFVVVILVALSGILIGYHIGYNIPRLNSGLTPPNEVVVSSLLKDAENRLLDEIEKLKLENSKLKTKIDAFPPITTDEEIEKMANSKMISLILNGSVSGRDNFSDNDREDIEFFAKRYSLTPDQVIQLELIWRKRILQRRLLRHGELFLTNDEIKNDYADLLEFDFDESVKSILSEDQLGTFVEKEKRDKEKLTKRSVDRNLSDLGITDNVQFSDEEVGQIRATFFNAAQNLTDIKDTPKAIREMNINPRHKRLLAQCYKELNSELFERVYESIVQWETENLTD